MSPCFTIFLYSCEWRLKRRGTVVYLSSSHRRTWKYLKICKVRKPDYWMAVRSWCSFLLVNNLLLYFTFLLFLCHHCHSTAIKYNRSTYFNYKHLTIDSYIMTINNIRLLCQYDWRNYFYYVTTNIWLLFS